MCFHQHHICICYHGTAKLTLITLMLLDYAGYRGFVGTQVVWEGNVFSHVCFQEGVLM